MTPELGAYDVVVIGGGAGLLAPRAERGRRTSY